MEAMNVLYSAVGLKWLSRFLTLPGVKEASDIVYPWFAINRYRLTGRNREECESGRCRISDRKKAR
jgi:predicted DCC family thiol-disulfide oxidoreductase YuxK